jgi:hypothetical protein
MLPLKAWIGRKGGSALAPARILTRQGGSFNMPNVLEHSLKNAEAVECLFQFAMLLRVCNR